MKVKMLSALLAKLMIFTGCDTMNKYDWLATESAPKNYPMQILSGFLSCPDGYAQAIPSMKVIKDGWGTFVSTHVVGPDLKPLPN